MRRTFLAAAVAFMCAALGVGASDAPAASTSCTGTITGEAIIGGVTITGNLSAGPGCNLQYVTVTGNVVVEKGGSLNAFQLEIGGNLKSNGATSVGFQSVRVNGNANIVGATSVGFEYVTVNGNLRIAGSTESTAFSRGGVGGNFLLQNNSGTFDIARLGVDGNMKITNNSGSFGYSINNLTVGGNLDIRKNRADGLALGQVEVTDILNCHHNQPPVNILYETTARIAKGECAGVPSAAG
jgi:hypothetical protein